MHTDDVIHIHIHTHTHTHTPQNMETKSQRVKSMCLSSWKVEARSPFLVKTKKKVTFLWEEKKNMEPFNSKAGKVKGGR
jgi:hypothetical protein